MDAGANAAEAEGRLAKTSPQIRQILFGGVLLFTGRVRGRVGEVLAQRGLLGEEPSVKRSPCKCDSDDSESTM